MILNAENGIVVISNLTMSSFRIEKQTFENSLVELETWSKIE